MASASIRAELSKKIDEKVKIGFLGMGIMGVPMAKNLIKAGFDVTVWNRTLEKCDILLAEGAKKLNTPKEVVENCDVTFAMLATPTSAIDVVSGEFGVSAGITPGKGYVDMSTVDATTSSFIANEILKNGGKFLEAPVSGSKVPAEQGMLIFLTAGDHELYDEVSPMLDVMGKAKFYLGEVGNGAKMKIVVNMIMGSMMASFSEGIVLGKKAGIDPQTILEVISQGPLSCGMFSLKGPSMLNGQFPPAFPLKHQQKDLRLAIALGDDVAQPLPIASAANEAFKLGRSKGLGDNDFSAVIKAIETDKPRDL